MTAFTAICLARSGSKGLPDKNLMKINGLPISFYPIKAANESKYISCLVYSSDSLEYLRQAQNFYDQNKFMDLNLLLHHRSKINSDDNASSWDAVYEVVETFTLTESAQGILLLGATCPSLTGKDVDTFFTKLSPENSAMSVREVDYPIENTFADHRGHYYKHSISNSLTARQEQNKYYRPDGHIYFKPIQKLNEKFPSNHTQLIDLKKKFYANIDTLIDFKFAKYMIEHEL